MILKVECNFKSRDQAIKLKPEPHNFVYCNYLRFKPRLVDFNSRVQLICSVDCYHPVRHFI